MPTPSTALATISDSFNNGIGPTTLNGNHLSSLNDIPSNTAPPPPKKKQIKLTANERYLAKKRNKQKYSPLTSPFKLDTISDAGTFEGLF